MNQGITRSILILSWLWGGSLELAYSQAPGQIRSTDITKNGITLGVKYESSYPTSGRVSFEYTIANQSDTPFILTTLGGDEDRTMSLLAPDGTSVREYERSRMSKSRKYMLMHRGEKDSGSRDLSYYFPFTQVGEYRCTFSLRIYEATGITVDGYFRQGKPIDITVPEFRFRVESIDPDYRSPLAPKPNEHGETGAEAAKTESPGGLIRLFKPGTGATANEAEIAKSIQLLAPLRWMAWLAGVLAVLGLLWLLIKKKRS